MNTIFKTPKRKRQTKNIFKLPNFQISKLTIATLINCLIVTLTFSQENVEWATTTGIQNSGEGIVKTIAADSWNNNLASSSAYTLTTDPCFSFSLASLNSAQYFKIALHHEDIARIDDASYIFLLGNDELNILSENFSQSLEGYEQLSIQIAYGALKVLLDGIEVYTFPNSVGGSSIKAFFAIYNASAYIDGQLANCTATVPPTATCQGISTYKYAQSKNYAPDGREIANGIQLSNNFGQATLSQSYNYENNQVIATQTIYDRQGRPALQTFPAPLSGSSFCYDPNFSTALGSVTPYNYNDFDQAQSANNNTGEEFNPKSIAPSSTLGSYYSGTANPNYSNTAYPYVRQHYGSDIMQQAEKVSGYSEVYKAGSGHEASVYHMLAGQTELDWVYGFAASYMQSAATENYNMNLFKTVSINENGETTILYSNSDDQAIASAQSGTGGSCISQKAKLRLKQYVQSLVHVPASKTASLRIHYPDPGSYYDNYNPNISYPATTSFKISLYDKLNNRELISGTDYSITHDAASNDNRIFKLNLLGNYQNKEAMLGISYELLPEAYTVWDEYLQYSWKNLDPQLSYELDYYNWQINFIDAKGNLSKRVQPLGINCQYNASTGYVEAEHQDIIKGDLAYNDPIYTVKLDDLISGNTNTLSLCIFPTYVIPWQPGRHFGDKFNDFYTPALEDEGTSGPGGGEEETPTAGDLGVFFPTQASRIYRANNPYELTPLHSAANFGGNGGATPPVILGAPDIPGSISDYWMEFGMRTSYELRIVGVNSIGTETDLDLIKFETTVYKTVSHDAIEVASNVFEPDFSTYYEHIEEIRESDFSGTMAAYNFKDGYNFDKFTLDGSNGLNNYDHIEIRIDNVKKWEKPELIDHSNNWTPLGGKVAISSIVQENINISQIGGTFGHKISSTPTSLQFNNYTETFEYDNHNRLIEQNLPDEGTSQYVYADDGKLKFSQNAQQATNSSFSYTLYDKANRPVESGVYKNNIAAPPGQTDVPLFFAKTNTYGSNPPANSIYSVLNLADGLNDANCFEVQQSLYDTKATDLPASVSSSFTQRNVRGRVSRTSNNISTTWYSYDYDGNVEWMVQDIYELGVKTIRYHHDNLGKLLAMDYNEGQTADDFYVKYSYDQNDALIAVLASDDPSYNFQKIAAYKYDALGNLIRKEIGNNYQGLDLAYTAKGQLKSINNAFQPAKELGQDGLLSTNTFIADLFAETLSYHEKDFVSPGSHIQTLAASSMADNYSGLIKSATWYDNSGIGLPNNLGAQPTYNYQYDRKGQLSSAIFGTSTAGSFNDDSGNGTLPAFTANANNDYKTQYSYDANGNISTLLRNAYGTNYRMDEFTYNYGSNKNSLAYVADAVSTVNWGDLPNQSAANYSYDELGRLQSDVQGDKKLEYNSSGLLTTVKTQDNSKIRLITNYNERHQNVRQVNYTAAGSVAKTTYRVYDVGGKLLAEYEKPAGGSLNLSKTFVHGVERAATAIHSSGEIEEYHYEVKDHIGNVRTLFRNNPSTELFTDFTLGSMNGWVDRNAATYSNFESNGLKITSDGRGGIVEVFDNLPTGGRYTINVKIENISAEGLEIIVRDQTTANSLLLRQDLHDGYNQIVFNNVNTTKIAVHIAIHVDHQQTGSQYVIAEVGVIKDNLEILAYTDYYPAGFELPGRHYQSSATDNEYGFSGDYARQNAEMQWSEYQYRNYDNRIARFLSPDPARQYHSPYMGLGNNPVMTFDPTGLWGYTDGNGQFLYIEGFLAHEFTDENGVTWTKVAESLEDMVQYTGGINNFAQGKLRYAGGESIGVDVFRNPSGHLSDKSLAGLTQFKEVHFSSNSERFWEGVRDNIPIVSNLYYSGVDFSNGDYVSGSAKFTMGNIELFTFGVGSAENQVVKEGSKAVTKEVSEEVAKTSSIPLKSTVGAARSGFSKLPKGFKQTKQFGYQHGQKVYKYKGKFYSRDIDAHNGGAWKVFENVGGRLKRIGTADEFLNIFKQ